MTHKNDTGFKTVISSDKKLFDLKLKEIVSYKDLVFLLVKRDFVSKYKQTVLGPLWAVIQPLLTTVVFSVIFGTLAGLDTTDTAVELFVPTFLFYMSGTIIWNYFSSVVTSTSNTFIVNSQVMGKVYFPRIAMPISSALSNLISFGIQLALFAAIYVVCVIGGSASFTLSPYILFLPLSIVQIMLLSFGVGIIVSALTTKYRDLAMLVSFGLQLWQYATPIAYGLKLIPERYYGLYLLNPVTPAVLSFRYAVFGEGYFDVGYYLIGWGITLVVVLVGMLLFNRIEKNFADTV